MGQIPCWSKVSRRRKKEMQRKQLNGITTTLIPVLLCHWWGGGREFSSNFGLGRREGRGKVFKDLGVISLSFHSDLIGSKLN